MTMNSTLNVVLALGLSGCLCLNYMEISQTDKQNTGIIDVFHNAGVFFCAKRCKQMTTCTSFNFHRGDLVCQLVGERGQMTNSFGWFYFDNTDNVKVRKSLFVFSFAIDKSVIVKIVIRHKVFEKQPRPFKYRKLPLCYDFH